MTVTVDDWVYAQLLERAGDARRVSRYLSQLLTLTLSGSPADVVPRLAALEQREGQTLIRLAALEQMLLTHLGADVPFPRHK